MRHEKIVKTTKKVVTYTCDVCEKHAGVNTCQGCGRDICNKCRVFWENDPWTGASNGDYPDKICIECNELVEPFADLAEKINLESEARIEVLQAEWELKCEALKILKTE